jgi:hypothetical protein
MAATILELIKDFWWAPRTVSAVEVPRIQRVRQELGTFTGRDEFLIVGGSYGLRLCTGRQFPVSDIDVFMPVIDANSMPMTKGNVGSADLTTECKLIERIYECTAVIKYWEDKSQCAWAEHFDRFIVGTINITFKGMKIQFVCINIPSPRIIPWYTATSDLPMFLQYSGPDNIRVHYTSRRAARRATEGFLSGICHEDRVEKYMAKGFIVA